MKFGDYIEIEQKRYRAKNEMYTCKVIRCLESNYYVDVPVSNIRLEYIHSKTVDVVACIVCGVNEREVHNYKISDVKKKEG